MSSILLIFWIGIFVEKADSGSVCRGSSTFFFGPAGTISSPNYPNEYGNSLDCTSYISVSYTDTVVITFFAFDTESTYDYVAISCYSGSFIGQYSGTQIPAVLKISSCSYVQLTFHTNSAVTKTGFSLVYWVTTACANAHFSGRTGTVSSPNYPNAYAKNLDCYSYIPVSSGDKILITFAALSTQSSNDWIKIVCASGSYFTPAQYSGSTIPAALTISSCSLVQVLFHTDASINSTGFSLRYNITSGCGDTYFSGLNGTISSPNYPNLYGNSLDCYSYVSVSSGHTVHIRFLAISTQSRNDWVEITCSSGNEFKSPRFSGSTIPAALTISACSLVKVYFHTDNSVAYTGFSLAYNISPGCGDTYFSGLNGTISSPNYPRAYANSLDCYSYVSVSSGHTVLISFSSFSTQSDNDWVAITCKTGNAFTSPRYSGSQIPAALTISACNLVKVYFHTDHITTYTGFSLTYNITSGCDDRYFSGPNGTISSPNYPMAYANDLDCYSYISVSSGHTVFITFLSFSTQSGSDWVTITCNSGNAFTSPQYSGSEIPDALMISACSLVKVYFHTDDNATSAGFSLTYSITSDEKTTLYIFILAALLGGAVLIIIILLVILLIRKSREKQEVTAADVGHDCDGNEHELHNRRSEGNVYANDFGNAAEVADSDSDDADNDYVNVAQVK